MLERRPEPSSPCSASVGAVSLSALGIDQDTAKKNALVVAAERAADEIVASLQAKGIN